MKAKLFGLVLVLAIAVGGIVMVTPGAQAASAQDGWKSSYSDYCQAYTNFNFAPNTSQDPKNKKFCGKSVQGASWFSLLQRNDAANTTPGDCGDICSTNWFSTNPHSQEAKTPDDKIAVPGNLAKTDYLPVWLYSAQRVNRVQSSITSGQSTSEIFVHSYVGKWMDGQENFKPGSSASLKGYINSAVGACDTTDDPFSGPGIIQRPGIADINSLGSYGGNAQAITDAGQQVSFKVGWLRQQAALYKAGKIPQLISVFQGLFYHGPNKTDASGCVNVVLNAKNIELLPDNDIFPRLSVTGINNVASVGSDTAPVQSWMTNDQAATYNVPSSAMVYDFTVSSINQAAINTAFNDGYSTQVWDASTNSVNGLCAKLPGLFVNPASHSSAISGFGGCSQVEGPYTKNTYTKGTTILDGPDGLALKTGGKSVGTIMCRIILTNNFNGDNNGTTMLRASAPTCFTVAKKPKVHILGGDLRVGGQVDTSSSIMSNNTTYGSWVEYGALLGSKTDATHVNIGDRFGSGASLRGGFTGTLGINSNLMTFSNTTSPTGQFGDPALNSSQDLTSAFRPSGPPARCTPGSLSNEKGCNDNAITSLSLNGNSSVSKTVYIYAPNAAVTVRGDIKYASGVTLTTLPQVVIIAASITIDSGVSQVDAWLLTPTNAAVTTPTLSTCNSTPASCTGQLTVHGPAATKNLALPRSYGSDDAASQDKAAETFDLRADSYLWEYNQQLQNYAPQTAGITNLPPRY